MRYSVLFLSVAAFALCSSVSAHEGHDHSHVHEESAAVVDEAGADDKLPVLTQFKPTTLSASVPFYDFFNADNWSSTWISSEAKKTVDGVEDEDLLAYRGQWACEVPAVWPGIKGDHALVVKTPAAHHAISAKFPNGPLDNTDKDLVIQYEVKFQKNHDCGGAYMKLLTFNESFEPKQVEDKTPYTIMFGPDKCGFTNKVHFIFRHKNPVTGDYEEKHMNAPPAGKIEKLTGLYTLIVRPDNSFEMLINDESVKKGSLLEDFTPAVNPPAEVDDETDSKPADWVEEAKIADPEASKPADWNEDAPMEIEDSTATKPSDWLDNEPLTVADPESTKPDDWDDEEDGDWFAPTVPNPKCAEVSGCGVWTRPMIRNPEYKGKWRAPMIDNPAYKGVWKPRKVANPAFFEDKHPSNFEKIGAIAFELWTVTEGITFDNVYVGHSIADAKKLATEQWAVKYAAEKAYEAAETVKTDAEQEKKPPTDYMGQAKFYLDMVIKETKVFIEAAKVSPVDAVKEHALLVGGFVATLVLVFSTFLAMISGGGSASKEDESSSKKIKQKKEDVAEPDDEHEEQEEEEEEENEEEDTSKPAKRKTKKADE